MKKSLDSLSTKTTAKPEKVEETPVVENISKPAAPSTEEPTTPEKPVEGAAKAEEGATPTDPNQPAPPADSFESLFPEPSVAISGPPGWIWWLILLVASIIVGVVGYGLARNKLGEWLSLAPSSASPSVSVSVSATPSESATATETPTPTASPTSTPASTEKSAITLRVLNGTTVTGAANTAKTALEKEGFTVRTIGNAKNQTYDTTMIYYAAGREAEAKLVEAALSQYQTTLEESTLSSPDMVLVVVGKK